MAEAFHKRNLGVVDEKRMGATDLQRGSASMDAFLKLKGSLFQITSFGMIGSFCVRFVSSKNFKDLSTHSETTS